MGHERERLAPGLDEHLDVAQELGDFEVRHSALATTEEGALPPYGKVDLGELEPILIGLQRSEPSIGIFGLGSSYEETPRGMQAPAHSAPQLVELGEAETFRAFDHDRARVRHVDTDLDDNGGHKYLDLPCPEQSHHVTLVLGLHPAVQEPDHPLGEDVVRELLVELLGGTHVFQCLRLLDERADHVSLPPFLDLHADLLVGTESFRGVDDPGLDRLPSRWQFVYQGDLEIAVEREGEGPRYRGGRHDEGIRGGPFLAEHRPLADAEAVLLVHNDEREVVEIYAFLYEGVRPDDDVGLAGCYLLQGLTPLRHALRAGEQNDVDGQLGQGRRDREVVLPGENLGRGHYGTLSSRLDRGEERGYGDHGLSAANIPLKEAAHGLLQAHVSEDLLYDPLLRPCQPEGEAPQEGIEEAPVATVPAANLGPLDACLPSS